MRMFYYVKKDGLTKVKNVVYTLENVTETDLGEQMFGNVVKDDDGIVVDLDTAWFNNSYEFNFNVKPTKEEAKSHLDYINEYLEKPFSEEDFAVFEIKCNDGMEDDKFEAKFSKAVDDVFAALFIM